MYCHYMSFYSGSNREPLEKIKLVILNDKKINDLNIGDLGLIALSQNTASTGYSWQVFGDNSGTYIIKKDCYVSGKPMPGAPGKIIWIIEALKSGHGWIKLQYKRPFSNEIAEERTYKINVF